MSIWMLYLRGSGLLLMDKSNVRFLFCFYTLDCVCLLSTCNRRISAIITPLNAAKQNINTQDQRDQLRLIFASPAHRLLYWMYDPST